jgi:flagellar biosynthesis protein FlhF
MEVKNFRAKSLQEALRLVRRELGPDAAVLRTREVSDGVWGWLSGARQIEVSASLDHAVPSRFSGVRSDDFEEERAGDLSSLDPADSGLPADSYEPAESAEIEEPGLPHPRVGRSRAGGEAAPSDSGDIGSQLDGLRSLVEQLCRQSAESRHSGLPATLFSLFNDLVDAEVCEEIARELVERVRLMSSEADRDDAVLVRSRLARMLEDEIDCCGPIAVTPGCRRVVGLVGPTGVGKTTTIAKLAARFHLQHRYRVGLLTLDTYRIAAVDQLRTYAEIIDLPIEVAASAREVRAAMNRLADMDLVLIDTVGRSPRDGARIQELQELLEESQVDEVQLVLSAVASSASMKTASSLFAPIGISSLLLTKLDEATGLGGILPLLRSSGLPLSYVTHGQSVPQDISAADRRQLARELLGIGDRTLVT